MFKARVSLIIVFLLFAHLPAFCSLPQEIPEVPKIEKPQVPQLKKPEPPKVEFPKTPSVKPPGFFKDFLELIKKHAVKKPTKQNLKDSIANLNAYIAILDSLIRQLTPLPPQKLVEFSLHAIEQSKYLSLYDSKNYYRTEIKWADYVGRAGLKEETPFIKRNATSTKTLYGFHPFWMGLNYYQYNFELYDRVAYYGYAVDPSTGLSATQFPAHSFATSQIVNKANERSGGKCKIDLCVESYGLTNNTKLFSEKNWKSKLEKLTDEVVSLVKEAKGGGVCLDFQQIATSDSSKFLELVELFYSKFNAIAPNTYQISMILPSYSQYFPYTMSGRNLAQLNKYVDRFIVMGYSSYSGLYNPVKDTLAAPITRDVLWNVLLVDDGINHYASLVKDLEDPALSSEGLIAQKLILSVPANEVRVLKADSVQIVTYSALKLLKLDEGFLKSFTEKLTYANLKNLKGVALWSTGYDNAIGVKDIHNLLAAYVNDNLSEDQSILEAMEKLIEENKSLTSTLSEFFKVNDSLSDHVVPLPEILKVDLPAANDYNYKTVYNKEAIIIHHIVVLCLIIFLFFACIGVIIALFSETVRETYLTRENIILAALYIVLIAIVLLLKKLNVLSSTVFLFGIGLLLAALIPIFILKHQKKGNPEDRP